MAGTRGSRPICLLAGLALSFAGAAFAQAPAEDLSDLFDPKNLGLETLRDAEGRHALQLLTDEAGKLSLAAFSLVHPREDREVQITEARSFAYDPAKRSLTIAFNRNDAGLRELSGQFSTRDFPAYVMRSFVATLSFEGQRKTEVTFRGAQMRPRGKRNCLVDTFAGANMGNLTLKAPWSAEAGNWVSDVAARENWAVIRRRIDFRRGEDEFDVIVQPGRELDALAAAANIPRLTCFSFGVDETEGADAIRIIDLPAGTLFAGEGHREPRPLVDLAKLLQQGKLDGLAPGIEIEAGRNDEPLKVTLSAPGRYFGLTQGADLRHGLTLALRIGRSPGLTGEIAESLRFIVKGMTRERAGEREPIPLRGGADPSILEILHIWQNRYGQALAAALKGEVN